LAERTQGPERPNNQLGLTLSAALLLRNNN
jgi:hypothetical protein